MAIRLRTSAAALASALLAAVALAAPAGAAQASGCQGTASSETADGGALDTVSAPGGGGTSGDPFTIEPDGPVSWEGSTTGTIKNGSWKVTSSLVSVSDSFDNDDGNKDSEGTKKLSDYVPAFLVLPGVYEVDVQVTGDGGTCTASGYVEVQSSTGNIVWTVLALVLLILGGLTVNGSRPRMAAGGGASSSPGDAAPDDDDGGAG